MSEIMQPPIAEFKATPRPANCGLWIECYLHTFKDRSVPKTEIVEAAISRNYSSDQIQAALNYLKHAFEKNHIANYWVSKDTKEETRGEYWRWCDMTIEQHASRVDDFLWFESLPG